MIPDDIREKMCNPPVLAENDQYRIKFATTEQEMDAVFKLRYEVFTLEQGRNADDKGSSGIDKDSFDDYCLHLVVEEKSSSKIVGTYRVHLGPIAANSGLGFYSSQEFEIEGLDKIAPQTVEVGRSCVSPEYRNGSVVALLWSGISATMFRSGLRYLAGCVSLENVNPAAGWMLYDYFREQGKLSDELHGIALPHVRMKRPSESEMEAFAQTLKGGARSLVPPLFKGYLRLGAKICSEPVFDRDFGTIDFLILVDVGKLPERYIKHFNVAAVV